MHLINLQQYIQSCLRKRNAATGDWFCFRHRPNRIFKIDVYQNTSSALRLGAPVKSETLPFLCLHNKHNNLLYIV